MKTSIYRQLLLDINKEDNAYAKRQLSLIKDNIDKLETEFKVTIEDIMIVLFDYEDRFKKIYDETYDESIRHSLEYVLSKLDSYFKDTSYDGDIVNRKILSNGIEFNDFERENYLKQKALNLKNKIADAIKIIALLCFIFCCVAFIAIFSINKTMGIYVLIGGVISSIFIFAIGEIIQILHDIRRKIYRLDK